MEKGKESQNGNLNISTNNDGGIRVASMSDFLEMSGIGTKTKDEINRILQELDCQN